MIPDVRRTHPDGQDGAGTGPVETATGTSSKRVTTSSSTVAAARASSAAAGTSSVTSRCVVNALLRDRAQTGFLHAVWTQWCVFRLLVRPTLSLILLQKAPQRNVRGKICRARHDCAFLPSSHSTLTFTKRLRRWRPSPVPSTLSDISTSPFPFSASASWPQSPSTILTDSSYRVNLVVWELRWVD